MSRMNENGRKGSNGFTLIELMIVVAIIGILASIAIPSFINYQLTSKRAEAFANLASLAKAQRAYYAEFNSYVDVIAEPSGATTIPPTAIKRDKTGVTSAFSEVGWTPDGDVFFDYDTVTSVADPARCSLCTAGDCFTATAYGDLDDDGALSVVMYAASDSAGGYCETWLANNLSPPSNNGARRVDEVVRANLGDDF